MYIIIYTPDILRSDRVSVESSDLYAVLILRVALTADIRLAEEERRPIGSSDRYPDEEFFVYRAYKVKYFTQCKTKIDTN